MTTDTPKPTLINLSIDGVPVSMPPGSTIIQASQKVNKPIAHFCYHPGLTVVGQCRMCFVEIEGAPKLATACSTPVGEGMKVLTESPKVKAGQKATLEFTLINHPLDCPICDRGGECKLQDYTYEYGPPLSRMTDEKKEWDKHRHVSAEIILDQERCILCTRCVRFSSEVDGRTELVVNDRGSHNHIDVFEGRPLQSKFSGNVVDLCPVGALTAKDFRFAARPWELKKHPAICTGCSMGCNIFINTKHRHSGIARPDGLPPIPQIVRLAPRKNFNINEWWMCDKGRWGYHFHNEDAQRLTQPMAKPAKDAPSQKISLRELQLVISEASDKLNGEWEFWVDDSASHELITWAKDLHKNWTDRKRKVAPINASPFSTELLGFIKSRSSESPWLLGATNWAPVKTVVASSDYRALEDSAPLLSLKLGQKVRKGQLNWIVRKPDALHDSSDDLATTAYLINVPKSSKDLADFAKVPAKANTLILWTQTNSRGLLAEGIAPIEAIAPTLKASNKKGIFYFGQKNQNEVNESLISHLKSAEFLIVADSFATELSAKANCIMPLTPVYESKATFTSLEGYRQFSEGVRIDHPNYEYLHRGGDVVPASLKVL